MSRHVLVLLRLFTAVAFFACMVEGGRASVVQLSDALSQYDLNASLTYFEDEESALSFLDVYRDRLAVPWKALPSGIPNFGFTRSAYWLYTTIEVQSDALQWYVSVDNSQIRELDLFVVEGGNTQQVYQTGDRFEFIGRPLESRTYLFPLVVRKGQTLELFFRIKGPYPLRMPVSIVEKTAYFQSAVQTELAYGLFFGFLIVMAVYNFFIFLATREFSYLLYVFFTLSTILFLSAELGFSFQYLWPSAIYWQHQSVGVLASLTIFFAAIFASEFLGLRKKQRHLFWLLQLVVVYSMIMTIVGLFVEAFYSQQMNAVAISLGAIVVLVSGCYAWRKGQKEAAYFVVAWLFYLAGVGGLIAHRQGFFSNVFWGQHSMEIGAVMELTLLSFALADKLNRRRTAESFLEQQAKDRRAKVLVDQELALERERIGNEQLAKNVKQRTESLHQALSELSLLNHKLEEMSTIDGVTGLKNKVSFVERLKTEWERAYRDQTPIALLLVEIERFDSIGDCYGYVAADESLKVVGQMLSSLVTRPADWLARVEVSVFGALLPNTDQEGIEHLVAEINHKLQVEPINLGVCFVSISVSCGASVIVPQQALGSELLLDGARHQLSTSVLKPSVS